jgi:hypothetical protein
MKHGGLDLALNGQMRAIDVLIIISGDGSEIRYWTSLNSDDIPWEITN